MIRSSCGIALALCVSAGSALAAVATQDTLFVLDQNTGNVLLIDDIRSATGDIDPDQVIATGLTISNRNKSELAATASEVYVSIQGDVYVYDIVSETLARSFNLGHNNAGLAVGQTDAYGDTLFGWNAGTLYLHDTTTGAELAAYDFSATFSSFSLSTAYDPNTGLVAVSDLVSAGLLGWIDPNTGTILRTASAFNRDYEGGLAYHEGTLFGGASTNRIYTIAEDGTDTLAFRVNNAQIAGIATIPAPGSALALGLGGLLAARRRR